MLFLLVVDYQPGVVDTPMEQWSPEEIKAHMDYYDDLNAELLQTGEYVGGHALTGPDLAKVVTSDGTAPEVVDGPFTEYRRMLAGYQLVDVVSEQRAIEIAARVSAVPGPGGVPLQQPITVRRVISSTDFESL
ncbi:YciI family protein [Actinoplanes sp. TFC3]|uniref:YciI family protein n=1 Tax=Actinoplanes sp. TFC3 TaxID=1710355 RepID=UPI000833354F|nr:YciI family protein [Actinoplanes sp. TFC3]